MQNAKQNPQGTVCNQTMNESVTQQKTLRQSKTGAHNKKRGNNMKISKRSIKSFFAAAIMVASVVASNAIPSFAAASKSTGSFKKFKTVHTISSQSGCTSMQGMAVGDTFFYTVKRNSSDTKAVLQRTHRKTGKTVVIKNGTSSTFSNLGHANDMDVIGLTLNKVRKSHLFVATMKKGSNSLVRMTVKSSENKATIVAQYRLVQKVGKVEKEIAASGVSVVRTTSKDITLLIKNGDNFYKAVVPLNDDKAFGKNEKSMKIYVSLWFKISRKNTSFTGKPEGFTSYNYQGCEYYGGKVFVPLAGNTSSNDNTSVILVYDLPSTQGKTTAIKNNSKLSFKFCWGAQFEVESCGINSQTGELYFNTNRHEGSGIHKVTGYKFS